MSGSAATIVIDCAGVSGEQEFWDRYLAAVRPETQGFGRNLDAFWDALAGGPGWPGPASLEFANAETLRPLRGGEFLAALEEIGRTQSRVPIAFG